MGKLKSIQLSKGLKVLLVLIILGSALYGAFYYGTKAVKPPADASWFGAATGAINDYVQFKGEATGRINGMSQNLNVMVEAINQLTARVAEIEKKK